MPALIKIVFGLIFCTAPGCAPRRPSQGGPSAILKVVGMDDPPLRLLLGSDAVRIVESADARKAEADRKGSDLSASTDFAVAS